MTTSKSSKRRFVPSRGLAMLAGAAVLALAATAISPAPANADEWRHHGWGGGWGGGFTFYSAPGYYYAPPPAYYYPPPVYYAPPPPYYAPAPAYYAPPFLGFSVNIPFRER